MVNPIVYFELSVSNTNVGRIVLQLFTKVASAAVPYFLRMCKGEDYDDDEIQSYKETIMMPDD